MADKKFETKVPRSENAAVLFEQMRAAGVALGSDREGLIKEKKMMTMTKIEKRSETEEDIEKKIVLFFLD